MDATNILKIIPGLQSTSLLAYNMKVAKNSYKLKPKASTKNIIKAGVGNLVGINLIKAQSKMIGEL